jgi:hypothetical protein
MANPHGNIATLESYKAAWRSGKTRTIRVPIVLADKILEYANKIDVGEKPDDTLDTEKLGEIKTKINEVVELLSCTISVPPNSRLTKNLRLKVSKSIDILETLERDLDDEKSRES